MQLDILMFFRGFKYADSENQSSFSCIAPQDGLIWLRKDGVTVIFRILKFHDDMQN